jgi:hypothetical protein
MSQAAQFGPLLGGRSRDPGAPRAGSETVPGCDRWRRLDADCGLASAFDLSSPRAASSLMRLSINSRGNATLCRFLGQRHSGQRNSKNSFQSAHGIWWLPAASACLRSRRLRMSIPGQASAVTEETCRQIGSRPHTPLHSRTGAACSIIFSVMKDTRLRYDCPLRRLRRDLAAPHLEFLRSMSEFGILLLAEEGCTSQEAVRGD